MALMSGTFLIIIVVVVAVVAGLIAWSRRGD